MEEKVLDILESSADEAQDEKVAALFRQHHEESQAHVKNLEEVSPCSAGRSTLDTVKRVQEQVAAVTPKQPA